MVSSSLLSGPVCGVWRSRSRSWTECGLRKKPTSRASTIQSKAAICSPRPVQKPRPPIMVGGDGERVLLRLVAQYGDWCNVHGEPADVRRKLRVLDDHCEEVGRDPKEIVKSLAWLAGHGRE